MHHQVVSQTTHSTELDSSISTDSIQAHFAINIIRRNGKVTHFDPNKITIALTKAFLAVESGSAAASRRIHDKVATLVQQIIKSLTRHRTDSSTIHIEDIQDQVELSLMRAGEHQVARAYVLYREQRAHQRSINQPIVKNDQPILEVIDALGRSKPLDENALDRLVDQACKGLDDVDASLILTETRRNLFTGIAECEVSQALIMSARALIEVEPSYSQVTARLLLGQLRREALSFIGDGEQSASLTQLSNAEYSDYFVNYIQRGIELELLDPKLSEFDLNVLGGALEPERDLQFSYLGLQTLYDRYFQHWEGVRFELPQAFFMRVAMGLASNEIDREAYAIEFYRLLSSFAFMSSTPTLFNSGTLRPQLSSCYLTTIPDTLDGIYSALKDNALLSKFAGGLGNDWTPVRSMGSYIKGTNGQSQGVVPFLKVANDTALAVNQGGKRKGAVCAYLETWHLDIEEFLELRKNTGDDRRRTHDMNTANWIPDLFMQRVEVGGNWTLFSPDDVSDLHDLTGKAFAERYEYYEDLVEQGQLSHTKIVSAVELWRKMLTMLFETGHPWITFKDACNLRSPQQHIGVVHSSNLCTEITLNTSEDEIAVCNLGSVNLALHLHDGQLDYQSLQQTVKTAMRMLDNVIDINFYSVPQARSSNLRHRPVGLGMMGFQDVLHQLGIAYHSEQAVELADQSMEALSYYAIEASSTLAEERGVYHSFSGSLWSQGILPIDSIALLDASRNEPIDMDRSSQLDWDSLRERVIKYGMRNSNCLAIAPTATISNIVGCSQSIEPTYQNLYVKSNLSGEFTVVNPFLVKQLKSLNLWDEVMVNDLKYFDGSVQSIDRIPDDVKALYRTAFEVGPQYLVSAASRRQKWIDQGQSLNLYLSEPSGSKLDQLYRSTWKKGLKTTYYLRTLGATHVEKSTVDDHALNRVQSMVCSVDDSECEACQ